MGTLVRGHCQKNKSLVCCLEGRAVTTQTHILIVRILPPAPSLQNGTSGGDSYGESWLGSGNSPFLKTEVTGEKEAGEIHVKNVAKHGADSILPIC